MAAGQALLALAVAMAGDSGLPGRSRPILLRELFPREEAPAFGLGDDA